MATSRPPSKIRVGTILTPFLVLAVGVGIGLSLIKSQLTPRSGLESSVEIQVGQVLPEFKLTQQNGSKISSSDLKGKLFFINFWATWCEACMNEMPLLVKLHQSLSEKGFQVVGVNLDENPEMAIPRAIKQYQIGFPVFMDPEGKAAELFDVHAIPLSVLIDRQRKILFLKNGELSSDLAPLQTKISQWLSAP